jgi:hypothetical protein
MFQIPKVQLENVKIFMWGLMPLDGIQAYYHNKTNTQRWLAF